MTTREMYDAYNATYWETEALYAALAKRSGLSDAAFRVLYTVWASPDGCTQKSIRDRGFLSKQTVNTAVRDLIRRGLVALSGEDVDRRCKRVALTEAGIVFSQEHIHSVLDMEQRAFARMTEEERIGLVAGGRRLLELFRLECREYLE